MTILRFCFSLVATSALVACAAGPAHAPLAPWNENARIGHSEHLVKARTGKIDTYFLGDSITEGGTGPDGYVTLTIRGLEANGVKAVSEGANMPTTLEGVHVFHDAKVLYAPGKAANAGGVAVSGLEMSQNAERISWNQERLGDMLTELMEGIHEKCVEYGDQGKQDGKPYVDYVKGANIAGFKKVADAMLAFGVV